MGRLRDALAGDRAGGDRRDQAALAVGRRPAAGRRSRRAGGVVRAGRRGRRVGARRRALRRQHCDDLRAARAATAPAAARQGVLLDRGRAGRAARRPAPTPSSLLLRDLDDETARRLHGPRRGARAWTPSSRRTTPTSSPARSCSSADPIGVNARDLATFEIDRARAARARRARAAGPRRSSPRAGSRTRAHGVEAELAGADAILVGSALMRAADPAAALATLLARPLVKVCGLTRQEDVDAAVEAGADLCGLRPRRARARGRPRPCSTWATPLLSVAVLVGEAERTRRRPRPALRARGRARSAAATPCCCSDGDARGDGRRPAVGGGRPDAPRSRARRRGAADARRAASAPRTSREAIDAVRPWAVDASSSLESAPGVKDHERVRAFVEAAAA